MLHRCRKSNAQHGANAGDAAQESLAYKSSIKQNIYMTPLFLFFLVVREPKV